MSISPNHLPLKFHIEGTSWDKTLTIMCDPTQPLRDVGRRALHAFVYKLADLHTLADPANDGPIPDEAPEWFRLVTRSGHVVRADRTPASYGLDPYTTLTIQRIPRRQTIDIDEIIQR